MKFIKNPSSQVEVKKMIKTHWDKLNQINIPNRKGNNENSNLLFDKILSQIENKNGINPNKKKVKLIRKIQESNLYKIAALIAIVFIAFYFFQNDFYQEPEASSAPEKIINSNTITLKLNNGDIKVISEDDQKNIKDTKGNIIGIQKGNQLNYSYKNSTTKLIYNELSVPYGKQFDLLLSDGTRIKLNAGTSIKYPVQFIKGQNRKIYLNGEAYFEVAKDKEHPFIINADDINVSVLGTQFNMSYYPEDPEISTVLVEGSVLLYENGKENDKMSSILLTPSHKASWNKIDKKMSVEKVDVDIYTAWKDGILLFKNAPFRNIKKKLERHFDITIENEFVFLDDQIYTASFGLETIEDILDSFKEDTPFEYLRENNKIIINKP